MIQRILELARAAGLPVMNIQDGASDIDAGTLEDFARAIAQDCIDACDGQDPRPDWRWSDAEEFAESRAVKNCITVIRERFGMKE